MKFSIGFFQIGKGAYISNMSSQPDLKLESLLNLKGTDHSSTDPLKAHASKYPYSSIIQLLYTKQLKSSNDYGYLTQGTKTSLFFPYSPWYKYLIDNEIIIDNNVKSVSIHSNNTGQDINPSDTTQLQIPLEPYHTIDYFASQGIKAFQIDDQDDIGKRVKSFTAWLKTMKRLQPEQASNFSRETESEHYLIDSDAINSETIVTESMADVYIKQGLIEKAIDIYHKLSLQNPDNSRIFADKISVLKENRP